jgi:hypothetical protein
MRRGALLVSCGAVVLTTTFARAQPPGKDLCLEPYERGQELRQKGQLRAARDVFRDCTRDACPRAVRVDCAQWSSELVAAMPTLVLQIRDDQGRDIVGVRVSVDGDAIPSYADGRPFECDPGVHVLHIESGDQAIEQRVVVREGEKGRTVAVAFKGRATPALPSASLPAQPPDQTTAPPFSRDARAVERAPIPALAWVLGGVGVAGLGVFATFAYLGHRQHDELRSSCAPHCSDTEKTPAVTDYAIGDITLGVSVVSLGIATWLTLTRPHATSEPRSARPDVALLIGPTGGGLSGVF